MIYEFKGKELTFPATLADITLQQRVSFYQEHGKALDEMAGNVEKLTDEFEREIETTAWQLEMAVRSFSFYAGIPAEEVRKEFDVNQLLNIFATDMQRLTVEESEIVPDTTYTWNNEEWVLHTPELQANSDMVFVEFITAKEVCRRLNSMGKGKWDALPYLCAIYLRKKGEAFSEDLIDPAGKRFQLMLTLPLNIAIAVGFFLTSILHTYWGISQYSNHQSPKASIPLLTLTDGDG